MKKSNTTKLLAMMMAICMLCLSACGSVAPAFTETAEGNGSIENVQEQLNTPVNFPTASELSNSTKTESSTAPTGEYNEGIVLVKYDGEFTTNVLSQLDFVSAEPLYKGSSWHTVTLGESMDTVEAVEYLTALDCFEKVDYDYVMKADGEVQSVDISGNTYAEDLTYMDTLGVKKGWNHNLNNGKAPGGSSDVVIAIIDTGVDYNHLDLRNNIWVNTAEIPDNGIDDDNNGYVDDIYGWNCVGDNNDPMDDNGHGTHVAGIAAAENNKIGTVGVAYNCKIMVLKAGNSSGYFNNSDIAEAVQYAYMNGASVINMSFGGSSLSSAVEEALENAYNQCVLVAAAGNDALCNNLSCPTHKRLGISYPAALPYVIGVMSCNKNGTNISNFSNFDHYPFGNIEYEVYACGEGIPSTWPNNKYAMLSGTSMAAPTVTGIAAVLRATYTDRDTYSNKFIQSQIVNTGTKTILKHTVADLYEALTRIPTPSINLYDYFIDDSTEWNANNNGNGSIDAGETIRLYVSLQNRGGVASKVNVTIDTMRNNDPSLVDPYFTFVNSSIQISDIGTYSVRDSSDENFFEIVVSNNCPNDYLVNFNIRFTYRNGLDENDDTIYTDDGKQQAKFNISNGVYLPIVIEEDMVLESNRLYLISNETLIREGVTVTVAPGAHILFESSTTAQLGTMRVSGNLICHGTMTDMVHMDRAYIRQGDTGKIEYSYTSFDNVGAIEGDTMDHCIATDSLHSNSIQVHKITNSKFIRCYFNQENISQMYAENCQIIDSSIFNLYRYTTNQSDVLYKNCVFLSEKVYMRLSERTDENSNATNSTIGIPFFDNVAIIGEKTEITTQGNGNNYNLENADEQYRWDFSNVYWGTNSQSEIEKMIFQYDVYGKYCNILPQGYLTTPTENMWPMVSDAYILSESGERISTVGTETVQFVVEFNRDMDTSISLNVTFGTIAPYADYKIDGEWITPRKWIGNYTLKSSIENGNQYLMISNAQAAEDSFFTAEDKTGRFSFNIDTTAAMSMNLLANPTDNGIELTWAQDDYDTLLGYNIYRAESKDGNYVKLNPAILLSTDESFLDENAEPGKTYWYTYTVVLSDFTESNPAGRVMATAKDTMAPSLYHTPVNQGYMSNNLVISCTASDNVGIESVVLYYRTVGTTEWKTLNMLKQNDKYSATVFGSEVTLAGLEYYVVVSDGRNTIAKGSADVPYTVVVKDASSLSRIGDVDGDGVVTTKDALMIMQTINGDLIMTDDEFKRADLNGDETLSSVEALRILQYINGNVTTLEM